ncbi:MAG: 50S ribosomal protein L21 [Acidobacteriota bacterium]|nr:MAG: 50S ribosomal protein L21 [Acidobacteriota bacterium]
MYAVIDSGGKQYRLNEGDVINVERLNGSVGDEVVFEDVLLLGGGEEAAVGTPHVQGARVLGTIVDQKKGDKVIVFKFKRRKMYRKKQGHRQLLTSVKIESIEAAGSTAPAKKAAAKAKTETAPKAAPKAKAETAPKAEKKAAKKPAAKKPAAKKAPKKTAKAEEKQEE